MHAPNYHTGSENPRMNPPPGKVLPVAADMLTVADHPQGRMTSSAKFFRDADSRTRVEQGDIAVISDPVKGESYVLKMAEKIAIPAKPQQPEPKLPNPALPLRSEERRVGKECSTRGSWYRVNERVVR